MLTSLAQLELRAPGEELAPFVLAEVSRQNEMGYGCTIYRYLFAPLYAKIMKLSV